MRYIGFYVNLLTKLTIGKMRLQLFRYRKCNACARLSGIFSDVCNQRLRIAGSRGGGRNNNQNWETQQGHHIYRLLK